MKQGRSTKINLSIGSILTKITLFNLHFLIFLISFFFFLLMTHIWELFSFLITRLFLFFYLLHKMLIFTSFENFHHFFLFITNLSCSSPQLSIHPHSVQTCFLMEIGKTQNLQPKWLKVQLHKRRIRIHSFINFELNLQF